MTNELADALPRLAHALAIRQDETEGRSIYTHIRELEQHMQATEQALSLGIDSARLNPWARRARRMLIGYPDVVLALDRLLRQMRRIAYTINESEASWSEIVRKQEWALDYGRLLAEIGSILELAAEYIRSSIKPQSSDLPNREILSTHMERAQQQLVSAQTQLVLDAKQVNSQVESNESSPINAGYRFAIRGSILTDIRRMFDEVRDVVGMTADDAMEERENRSSK